MTQKVCLTTNMNAAQEPTPLTTTAYYYMHDHPKSNLSAPQFDHVSHGMYASRKADYGFYNKGNINERS